MEYKEWKSIYEKIVSDLGLNEKEDAKAASFLQSYLNGYPHTKTLSFIKPLLFHRDATVFGAGPSLESSIQKYKSKIINHTTIAADGATTALLKHHILPDIIITDLDGYPPDQIDANKQGSIVIVHAHGDNLDTLTHDLPLFQGTLIGSTQVNPIGYTSLFNVGGFTDGDRGIYLADHFQAQTIFLIGFDCDDEIGPYSFAHHKNKTQKRKKLNWCKRIIDYLDHDDLIVL